MGLQTPYSPLYPPCFLLLFLPAGAPSLFFFKVSPSLFINSLDLPSFLLFIFPCFTSAALRHSHRSQREERSCSFCAFGSPTRLPPSLLSLPSADRRRHSHHMGPAGPFRVLSAATYYSNAPRWARLCVSGGRATLWVGVESAPNPQPRRFAPWPVVSKVPRFLFLPALARRVLSAFPPPQTHSAAARPLVRVRARRRRLVGSIPSAIGQAGAAVNLSGPPRLAPTPNLLCALCFRFCRVVVVCKHSAGSQMISKRPRFTGREGGPKRI